MMCKGLVLKLSLSAAVCSLPITAMTQTANVAAATTVATSAVPRLITYSGVLKDAAGKTLNNITGVTFLLYKDEQGGSPLWLETQNVTPDRMGHYSVQLGASSAEGLPPDLFVSGEARWLAVQVVSDAEQERVLLVAVPYAMKAADAETIGGLPPSAFVLANREKQGTAGTAASTTSSPSSSKTSVPPVNPPVTGKGVVGFVPMWDTTSDIVDSVMFQKSSQIGFGTTSPTATIDVNGKGNVRDTLTLFPKSTDNTLAVSGTAFKIGSTGTVTFISGQKFPGTGTITGVTTSSTSGLQGGGTTGTLNLSVKPAGVTNAMLQNSKITLNANTAGGLTTPGAMTLGSTFTIGLKPCSASQVLQFNGTSWACAAVGTGTITGVTAGSGLSGGGTSGNVTLNVKTAGVTNSMLQNSAVTVNSGTALTGGGSVSLGGSTTLNLDTTKVPLLAAANSFANNQSITGNLSVSGSVSAAFLNTTGVNTFSPGFSDFSGTEPDWIIDVVNSGGGNGIISLNEASSGSDAGVYAASTSSTTGNGVFAQQGTESSTATNFSSDFILPAAGVWGDGGQTANEAGVIGTVDNGFAGFFVNNSSGADTLVAWTLSGASNPFFAGNFVSGANCNIDVNGNINCTGSKNAIVPIDGGARTVALSAIESPKNWFEDFGSAELAHGTAVVQLDAEFMQTVNTDREYQVFLTPYGDCKGLYVTNRTPNSFEVHELGGGGASLSFGYRITALRRKYEDVRFADHTRDMENVKLMQKHGPMIRHSHAPDLTRQRRPASPKAMLTPTATKSLTR